MIFDVRFLYIGAGIICSSAAQICMKLATSHEVLRLPWVSLIFLSIFSYSLSFLMYYLALKHFPISRVSPIMTVGVVMLVVLFGVFAGEVLSLQQILGILLGILAIILLLL